MKHYKIIGFSIAAVAIAALGYFLVIRDAKPKNPSFLIDVLRGSNEQLSVTSDQLPESLDQEYRHETYRFSFSYPGKLRLNNFADQGGEMILVQEPGSEIGFQVFILPFDEPEISIARIKRDLPNMKIESDQKVTLADGTSAITFLANEPGANQTREIWFVHGGNLYQISAFAKYDSWLASIMQTWSFDRR